MGKFRIRRVPTCLKTTSKELMKVTKLLKLIELSLFWMSMVSVHWRLRFTGSRSSLKNRGNSETGLRLAKNVYTIFLRVYKFFLFIAPFFYSNFDCSNLIITGSISDRSSSSSFGMTDFVSFLFDFWTTLSSESF